MSQSFHDADTEPETPTDSELLAEAGLDARAIREALAQSGGAE
ncbi:MAG: hypothetical protein OXH59_08710 [Rhodospirillaceae bacterium]|nr:hypothetical protein [Rhodospirillaceae bacterium]